MNAEAFLHTIGLAEFLGKDVLGVQLVVLVLTSVVFVLSLAFMIVTARAANGARRALRDAESQLRSAQDFVVEARQLSAQIERAAKTKTGEAAAPIRIGARETTPEAGVEIVKNPYSETVSHRNLDAAKESATVPKGLLGRPRRR